MKPRIEFEMQSMIENIQLMRSGRRLFLLYTNSSELIQKKLARGA